MTHKQDFEAAEKYCDSIGDFVSLAEQVIQQLDDKVYATQLLKRVEEMLDNSSFSLEKYQQLIVAIDQLTGDSEWVIQLLDNCREKIEYFVQLQSLGQMARSKLSNKKMGLEWAHSLYKDWEQKLLENEQVSPYELSKLARSVKQSLGDHDWAIELLEKAGDQADSHLELCWLGFYANQWLEHKLAHKLYLTAAKKCENPQHYAELVRQLRGFREPESLQRELYAQGEKTLKEPLSILRWAEGIMHEFSDLEWATRIYEALEPGFENNASRGIYHYSRRHWIDFKYE